METSTDNRVLTRHLAIVQPTPEAPISALKPLSANDAVLTAGFWVDRQRINAEVSIVDSLRHLEEYGALPYLRAAAAGDGPPEVRRLRDQHVYKILDSDIVKWLELVAYESMRAPLPPDIAAAAEEIVTLLTAAQTPDGACHSWTRVHGVEPLADWREGHETYCGGHLIQAGIGWHRATGDRRLLEVAERLADFFQAARTKHPDLLPLHPGLEMALAELYRETGHRRFLDQAADYLDRRGSGRLGDWRFSPDHFVDDEPVRGSTTIRGHAVMALYLLCGVVDVAVETGDEQLLAGAEAQWRDMVETKLYVTGGAGSRQHDEAFGDPYELAPDTAYAETCAAVASVMLSWRLLLATGRSCYADLIERTVYNGALSGVSLEGSEFLYVNPLQVRRPGRILSPDGYGHRQGWFECACCPPNLMRLITSIGQLLASQDLDGVQIHQFISASVETSHGRLAVRSDLPFGEPRVDITIETTDPLPWTLRIRRPDWAEHATVAGSWTGEEPDVSLVDGYWAVTRVWAAGDAVSVTFDVPVRRVAAHSKVDALRGQRAFMRGPLVLCVEDSGPASGIDLDSLRVPRNEDAFESVSSPGWVAWRARLQQLVATDEGGLYRSDAADSSSANGATQQREEAVEVDLIPYFAWGNRGACRMRVWLPLQDELAAPAGVSPHS